MSEVPESKPAEIKPEEASLSRIPFTAEDESNIRSLAWWLRASGFVTLASVVFGIVEMVRSGVFSNVAGLAIMTAVAVLSIQAAGYFNRVATTDEADQAYLVSGFRKLRVAYLMLSMWIIIGLVFLCAIFLFAIVAAIVFAAR